jgi:hypothetical protein
MATADLDLVRQLAAAEVGLAIVSIIRADNTVHSSLVNAGVFAHPANGEPVVAFVARGDAYKVRRLRTSGRACVAFRSGWQWASVEGPVELAGPDDAHPAVPSAALPALLRDVFVAAGGSHDDWDEYDRVMAAERRTAVLVHPARATTNG